MDNEDTLYQVPPLTPPTITGLREDGLLPVDLLDEPINVLIPVWEAARPTYTYQLLWDGERTGPLKEIKEEQFGDVLTLELAVELLTEGGHSLAYEIMNPVNMRFNQSEETAVLIDKTAPGAPQLAPIIFPDAIQNGLTSSELESLNNVLPGKIASYGGISEGDAIRTYWGSLEGPITFVSANDMGLNRVMVDFPRALLEQVGDGQAPVHYTVTDQAGNLSMPSENVSVTLELSVIAPLPAPSIKEAVGDTLDPAAAVGGATVVIDSTANLQLGEKVVVRWKGPKGSDEKEKVVSEEEAGKSLEVVFAAPLVAVNDGQTVEVSYSVTRTSGIVQDSNTVALRILSAVLELPAPTMDTVGSDGILRPSLIPESGGSVRVSYPDSTVGDLVMVRWMGTYVEDTPAQTIGAEPTLTFNVSKAAILDSEGKAATLHYYVQREGVDRESEKLALTVTSALEFDTSAVVLSGKVYLLPGSPELLPAFPTGTTLTRVATGGKPPYVYASSDVLIAHVDTQGLVSVRGNGSATITATDAAGESKAYSVSVTGVIHCIGVGSGTLTQLSNAATAIGARIPNIQELIEIYNAYNGRWPMGKGLYWSSTVAKNVLGAKWYYAKDLDTGKDFKYLHINGALGVSIR
jgi:hypothetical protein